MKTNHKSAPLVLVSFLCLGAAGKAAAQSTWDLSSDTGCSQNSQNSGSFNNSWACSNGSSTVTLSAWSSDRGVATTSGGTSAARTAANTYYLSGSGYASAYLSPQGNSGFGGTSRYEAQQARLGGDTTPLNPASPNHSFDAIAPGSMDALLLSFSTAAILDKIGIGWKSTEADITLMRWVGNGTNLFLADGSSTMSGDGHQNLSNVLYSSGAGYGWQLVGSYKDLGVDNTAPFGGNARSTGATDAMASSWWLVSTFNTTLNGGTSCRKADGTTTTCDASDDSFKFNYVAVRSPTPQGGPVPEPTSLALVGAAALGFLGARRRQVARTG